MQPQRTVARVLWIVLAGVIVSRLAAGGDTCSRAILINMSGLGQQYLQNYTDKITTLSKMMREGVVFNTTRSQVPVLNTTNIVSLLTGQEPGMTGVFSEAWGPDWTFTRSAPPAEGYGVIPTPIWDHIKQQNPSLRTSAIYGDEFIKYFTQLHPLDYDVHTHGNDILSRQFALDIIQLNMTDFMYIHLTDMDMAGHLTHWGSPLYYMQLSKYDNFLAQMEYEMKRRGYDQDTLFIITADHGRHGGEYKMADMNVPLIVYGPCLGLHEEQRARASASYASTLNIAPTLLYTLGLKPGPYMTGRVLTELFNR